MNNSRATSSTSLVARAAAMNPPGFVRVDMEGSPYTQRTLDFVHELHRMPGNANSVGTVIQAYLKRSESDVEKLLSERIRIRLCKGAYKEPASIAFESKADVDANFVKLMKILLKSGVYHGMASHDENMIRETQAFATRENIPRDSFEFQMLYGIRRDLQQKLVREGWRMRVYVPFGTEWYPYFMRGWASARPTCSSLPGTCCGRSRKCHPLAHPGQFHSSTIIVSIEACITRPLRNFWKRSRSL